MRFRHAKVITVGAMIGLLLSSFIVIAGGMSRAEARETSPSKVSAASGSNRFIIWVDNSLGNPEIFLRRSTDNGVTWQPAVNLSNNPGRSLDPLMVVSGSNVHVIWHQDNSAVTSRDVFIRTSTNDGATWGAKVNLSLNGKAGDAHLAASGNNVYVVYTDSGSGRGDIFFRRSTDGGATWKPGVNLSNNFAQSNSPDVAASGSNVYVVWSNWGGAGEYEIFFKRSLDSGTTWKANVNISKNPTRSSEPQIAASGSNVYVAWPDGFCFNKTENCDILFSRSANSGAAWTPAKNLSNTDEISILQQFAVSGNNVYLVWVDKLVVVSSPDDLGEGDIFFRRSLDGGATWKPVVNLSNNPGDSQSPQIAVAGSNVYTVWGQKDADDSSSDSFFRRSADGGATWKAKVNLSKTGDAGCPDIASSGSNVYAAWNDVTLGSSGIFFQLSTNNGANWEPAKNLDDDGCPQIAL